MRYMGSKARIAKEILPIILKNRNPGQLYIEPFVGGGNSFELVDNPKIGYDINEKVIQALCAIRDYPEELPEFADDISIEMYQQLKKDYTHRWHAYVGFACSFGGKWYGGRIKAAYPSDSQPRDRVNSQYREAQITSKRLENSVLIINDYRNINPKNAIIYCDPPYKNTTGYGKSFDHKEFWEKCRQWAKQNEVFVSEYEAPEDFKCVWSKNINKTLNKNNQQSVEKLFTI